MGTLRNAISLAMEKGQFTGIYKIRVGRKYESVPLYTLRGLMEAVNAIESGQRYETINEQTKLICEAYGMKCDEKGVGWIISA